MRTVASRTALVLVLSIVAPASLAGQREVFTLHRLVRKCDVAGLFCTGQLRPAAPGEPVLEATCLEAVKDLSPRDKVLIRRRPAFCHTPDPAALAGGTIALFFLRREPGNGRVYRLMPGGYVPGDEKVAAAAAALAGAGEGAEVTTLLVEQLGHPARRVRDDAVFALFRRPEQELGPRRTAIAKALADPLVAACREPGVCTTWYIRLAIRVGMKEASPEVARLALRVASAGAGPRDFLVRAMQRLDPEEAALTLARVDKQRAPVKRAVATLLGELGSRAGAEALARMSLDRHLALRLCALRALARVAPDHRLVRTGLHRRGPEGEILVATLLQGGAAGARVLREEAAGDDWIRRFTQRTTPTRPRFKALFPGRRR